MLRNLPTYARVVERFVLGMNDRRALLEENLRTSLRQIKEAVENREGRTHKDDTETAALDEPVDLQDCLECGFDASTVSEANAEETIRNLGAQYEAALLGGGSAEHFDALIRKRPQTGIWSALEYAAHVRDVVALWGWALHRTLNEEIPPLPAADPGLPDMVAAEADYGNQDPGIVKHELSANTERMAKKVATISAEQWLRTARFGETEIRPLWIVRKVAHEGRHHLLDIEKSLGASGAG